MLAENCLVRFLGYQNSKYCSIQINLQNKFLFNHVNDRYTRSKYFKKKEILMSVIIKETSTRLVFVRGRVSKLKRDISYT